MPIRNRIFASVRPYAPSLQLLRHSRILCPLIAGLEFRSGETIGIDADLVNREYSYRAGSPPWAIAFAKRRRTADDTTAVKLPSPSARQKLTGRWEVRHGLRCVDRNCTSFGRPAPRKRSPPGGVHSLGAILRSAVLHREVPKGWSADLKRMRSTSEYRTIAEQYAAVTGRLERSATCRELRQILTQDSHSRRTN